MRHFRSAHGPKPWLATALLLALAGTRLATQLGTAFQTLSPGQRRSRLSRFARNALPSWSALSELVPSESPRQPALTLYRDTNGWCPFCERVWIALREKEIPYEEVLISLFDKPSWYKDMVPTNLVPAVKFADTNEVVWESDAILRRLDTAFPETKPLFQDVERIAAASKLTDAVMNASFGLAYRTGDLEEESLESRRSRLTAAIDALEATLEEGPYLLGEELSAADLMAVPMLERYGVQLPFFPAELNLRDAKRWPNLARWFDAMESRPAYSDRVVGDEYSWTAVAPVLMRIFGGNNGTLDGAAAERAARADAAASELLGLAERESPSRAPSESARLEAARKLLSNREAVIADATNTDPKSQKELQRLPPSKASAVDVALRLAVQSLLQGSDTVVREALAEVAGEDVVIACRFVAARLSAPRDMGAPAAAALRDALLNTAKRTSSVMA